MAKDGHRIKIRLESTAGTGYAYTSSKKCRSTTKKLELIKYDPVVRKRVVFKESKI